MVGRRKVISSPRRRPISLLTPLPPTFRLPRGSRTPGRASPAMWDAIAWARRAASFRRHSLEREGRHGLADPIVTPQNTLDYCSAVEKPAGDSVADHFHLLMIPAWIIAACPRRRGGAAPRQASTLDETSRGYQ